MKNQFKRQAQALDIAYVLVGLCERIRKAAQMRERRLLMEIHIALVIIRESCDETDDMDAMRIILKMEWVAKETAIDLAAVKNLPSRQEIIDAFQR